MEQSLEPMEVATIVHEKPLAGACEELLFGLDRGNTLWVKFSDRDGISEWIGKFGSGTSSAMRVTKAAPPDKFMIAAGGFAYLVDATRRVLLNQHLDQFTQDIAYEPSKNYFVVADYVRIRLVDGGSTRRHSRAPAGTHCQRKNFGGANLPELPQFPARTLLD